ncbi:hypothetical protein [Legionella londiniensis]|uniref:Transmembrane protein n=1 Tax=Legionella londiniensis TaxID=45068 RepID=A0A0W0VIE1_9GAMM|nr:hypothetical protein [Legionella londiniensis]KTD19889.1 hypothetical protein Llon_2061 [Legionella londiniensis]STX94239.1 Uncharacterised protein [Legionella londiniensis]
MLEFLRNHWKGMVFGAIAFAIVALSIAAVILLFPPAGALISALAATPLFAYMGAAAFGVATASVALAGALAVTSGLLVLKGIASLVGKLFNPSSQTQAEEYVVLNRNEDEEDKQKPSTLLPQLLQKNEINKKLLKDNDSQDQQPPVLEQRQQDDSVIEGSQDGVDKKTSTPVSIPKVGMFKQPPTIDIQENQEEEQHDDLSPAKQKVQ